MNMGFTSLFFISIWIPIFLILLTSLWIQASSTRWVLGQRSLDRCVSRTQTLRCSNINEISSINQRLDQVLIAAESAWKAQAIVILAPAAKATFETLKSTAQILAALQNKLIHVDSTLIGGFILCGSPSPQTLGQPLALQTHRPYHPLATALNLPAPLAWKHPWKLQNAFLPFSVEGTPPWISFGFCQAQSRPLLWGERYLINFQPPPDHNKGKSFWKHFLSGVF